MVTVDTVMFADVVSAIYMEAVWKLEKSHLCKSD